MSRIRKLYLWVLIGQLSILLVCCSPKYSVLSFFFDGVPEQDSPVESRMSTRDIPDSLSSTDTRPVRSAPSIKYHAPYMKRKCEFCHDQNALSMLTLEEPGLCYQCHDDNSKEYRYMHGPVSGGYCTACHNPHTNKHGNLINREGQNLCIFCHNADMVFATEAHRGEEETECMDCHNAHGGDNRYYLIKNNEVE